MKYLMVASVIVLAGISGEAMATCTADTRVTDNALNTLVIGNTVCATRGTNKWQEEHRVGGTLWNYKKGPHDPVDPSQETGSWSIAANNITYSYTGSGGASHTYSIHDDGGTYSFCTVFNSSPVVSGAIFTGDNTSCL